jgi:hypothetical protein
MNTFFIDNDSEIGKERQFVFAFASAKHVCNKNG